jgi:hypothetical protein
MPFCSPRCRTIDLGRWLDEKYGLPYKSQGDPEDPAEGGPAIAPPEEDV